MGSQHALVARALATSVFLVGCSDASGCSDFNPASAPLAVGETTEVEVEVVGGGWSTPDVAGNHWTTETPVPDGPIGCE